MNHPTIPIVVAQPDGKPAASRERKRQAPRGRRVEPDALAEVQALLGDAPRRRDLLIEHLHRIQDRYGCLATRHLAALAQELRMAQAEVYEVASFYHHFDIVREGEAAPAALTVRVCAGLSCEMAGASALLDKLPTLLGTNVRVLAAPCIGRCEQAPAALAGQRAVPRATTQAIAAAAAGTTPPVSAHVGYDDYVAGGGYALLRDCVAGTRGAESLIAALEHAGLRGLGGAGFPAGRKWRIVKAEAGPRLMAVNLDEGEPGTFKDRVYLERDPHRFIEGMLLAAWAVGIRDIYIYVRDEYHDARALLAAELERLRVAAPVPGLPAIHLRRGAGAYICGEESAMIESIEGKRGMPRLRPPYVAQVGLFGRPTLEHNFETLYWVRDIVQRGPDWFAGQGRHGRKGLRSYSVSGRVREPGVKLAPAGITVRELIAEYCGGMAEGHTFYGYLPGGASGGILPAALGDVPLDFDTLQPYGCFIGSAAVIVLSQQDSAVAAARNTMRFFRDESCGQCTPCRVGTAKALQLIEAPRWDTALLGELGQVMRDASICGLGQAAPNPVDCVIRYFPQELA
ncbi:NAD(P)H-dependent oxidoreductase subunit E [Massilia sp. YMA4]|uniref:NAD(P)H-dependent oxidoreductase subunit E n=1 Tax=Massilia sp. YMA4 TaxID=1593482 RepID=UPI000DD16E6D|nr:NAD(P)H-dependent oxidoreductase subunit E [Massilia sp. YMA4]AXA90293.1 NADH-quinone oxidoreductase subunit F [Massilia sp. YMA4]